MTRLPHKLSMNIRSKSSRITLTLAIGLGLTACQTVKIPKVDLFKTTELSEDASSLSKEYPRVEDAPLAPTDIRSAAAWDRDARALQAFRSKVQNQAPMEPGPTKAEADVEFEALKAKAQAYKIDDPASGPVDGFPDYEPRR